MGSIMSAIRDDEEEYEALCKRYGEQIQYSNGGANPYSKHADALKERAAKDYQIEQAAKKVRKALHPTDLFDIED